MRAPVAVPLLAAVALLISSVAVVRPASAGGDGKGSQKDVCVYSAHGSESERTQHARAGGPSGGGGKTDTCSKTYAKWNRASLNLWLDGSGGPLDAATYDDYARKAFAEWSCHSGLGETVTLVFLSSPTGADITLGWSDLGTTGILGQTTTWYASGVISSSIVQMNTNQGAFLWTAGPSPSIDAGGCAIEAGNGNTNSNYYDFLSVLTHEIGHSLGISHPSRRCSSVDHCYPETMYSCTDAEEYMRRALNPGDVLSVSALYGTQP